eukprot:scaffold3604_cov73-Skeletonema_menzelii.AAC.3
MTPKMTPNDPPGTGFRVVFHIKHPTVQHLTYLLPAGLRALLLFLVAGFTAVQQQQPQKQPVVCRSW